jgi:PAS domain-containing protein
VERVTAAGRQVAAGERVEAAFIVESSHDAIVGVTRDGVVCQWNPAAERLYGYPDGEIIGRSAETLVPVRTRRPLIDTFLRAAVHHQPRPSTNRAKKSGACDRVRPDEPSRHDNQNGCAANALAAGSKSSSRA